MVSKIINQFKKHLIMEIYYFKLTELVQSIQKTFIIFQSTNSNYIINCDSDDTH